MRDGIWIPGQRQRLRRLPPPPGIRPWSALLGNHGRQDDDPAHAIVEIAIYPDVVWLAARSLREHSTSHRAVS